MMNPYVEVDCKYESSAGKAEVFHLRDAGVTVSQSPTASAGGKYASSSCGALVRSQADSPIRRRKLIADERITEFGVCAEGFVGQRLHERDHRVNLRLTEIQAQGLHAARTGCAAQAIV